MHNNVLISQHYPDMPNARNNIVLFEKQCIVYEISDLTAESQDKFVSITHEDLYVGCTYQSQY
jgi:hypothetical protein